jgi:hypothetical protein
MKLLRGNQLCRTRYRQALEPDAKDSFREIRVICVHSYRNRHLSTVNIVKRECCSSHALIILIHTLMSKLSCFITIITAYGNNKKMYVMLHQIQ